LPGCAVLTGSLWGPFLAGLFSTAGLTVTWFEYARVMALPTVVWCGLIVIANLLVMRPPPAAGMQKEAVRAELLRLGPMRRPEAITAMVIGASVVTWALQPWHRVPAEAIGMVALAVFFATRVLGPADIGPGIPWALAIFVGGMFSLTTVMTTYKINLWLGSYIIPAVQPFVGHPLVLAVAMSAAVAAMRFVDPVGFITIAAFFLPLVAFVSGHGVPPLVLAALIIFPTHVFWFNYQNIWIVMTEGISKKSAYTDADRFTLATTFIGVTIVSLWIGVAYWTALGIL
jgi:divalent anion:Na+ symporter, DASS family